MYRHPSLPWNMTCRAQAPPPPTPVPPATFSSYSCVGPAPFLSPSNSSYTLKTGLNRQRVCMLRNVCVVDADAEEEAGGEEKAGGDPADGGEEEQEVEHDVVFALKSIRMYRPRRPLSSYGKHLRNSTLEELLLQPWQGVADGEGLVHLHAWENHHGGDPSVSRRVLGASPSVRYGQHPPSNPPSLRLPPALCSALHPQLTNVMSGHVPPHFVWADDARVHAFMRHSDPGNFGHIMVDDFLSAYTAGVCVCV